MPNKGACCSATPHARILLFSQFNLLFIYFIAYVVGFFLTDLWNIYSHQFQMFFVFVFFFCTSSWIWGVSNFKLKSSCSQMLIIFEHFGPILNVSRQLSCKFKKANKQDFFFYHAHWCCLCKQSSVLMFVLYILFLSNHDFSVL